MSAHTGYCIDPATSLTCEVAIENGSQVWFCSKKDFPKLGVYLVNPLISSLY